MLISLEKKNMTMASKICCNNTQQMDMKQMH